MSNKRLATETIVVRVTPEDKTSLQAAAEAAGYEAVSTWLRHLGKKEAKKLEAKRNQSKKLKRIE